MLNGSNSKMKDGKVINTTCVICTAPNPQVILHIKLLILYRSAETET